VVIVEAKEIIESLEIAHTFIVSLKNNTRQNLHRRGRFVGQSERVTSEMEKKLETS
jgi:hypothetical protein